MVLNIHIIVFFGKFSSVHMNCEKMGRQISLGSFVMYYIFYPYSVSNKNIFDFK
jgi:hypothetical protein